MKRTVIRFLLTCGLVASTALLTQHEASACVKVTDCATNLDEGAVTVSYEGAGVDEIAGATGSLVSDYQWRLIDNCLSSAETRDYCSPTDVRQCPQVPNRVVAYLVAQNRPVVRPDGRVRVDTKTEETVPAPAGFRPGDPVGDW